MDSKNLLKELLKDIADLFTLNECMINKDTPEKFQVDRARQKAKNMVLAYDKLSEMLGYDIPNSHINTEFELITNFLQSGNNTLQKPESTKVDISELTSNIKTLVETLVEKEVKRQNNKNIDDITIDDFLDENSEIAFNKEFENDLDSELIELNEDALESINQEPTQAEATAEKYFYNELKELEDFENSILQENNKNKYIDSELNTEIPIVEDYFKDELAQMDEYLTAPSRAMSNFEDVKNNIPEVEDCLTDEADSKETEYVKSKPKTNYLDNELNTEIPIVEDYFKDGLSKMNSSDWMEDLQKDIPNNGNSISEQGEIEKDIDIELKLDNEQEYERQSLAMEKLLNYGAPIENNKPINRIIEAIGLNERFVFISDLFDNDTGAFYHTVQAIDQMNNIQDANNLISKKYKWDTNSNSYKKFMNLVNRRFLNK